MLKLILTLVIFVWSRAINFTKTRVSDYGAGDSYGSPLPPEVLEHNPKLKFYPEANIKTYDSSSQNDYHDYAPPKPAAHQPLVSQNYHHSSGNV